MKSIDIFRRKNQLWKKFRGDFFKIDWKFIVLKDKGTFYLFLNRLERYFIKFFII
jgi:hypothetical protein